MVAGQEQSGQRFWPCRTPMESCPSAGLAAATSLEVHLHVIRQALRDMVLQEKSWLNRKVVKICLVCGPLLLLTLRPHFLAL